MDQLAGLTEEIRKLFRDRFRLLQPHLEDYRPLPSYWVAHRIVSSLPADLLTLAHEGTKAYSNSFELVHRREADGPNAICRPITRRSTFCRSARMARPPSDGSVP
jgi:hypothetical protein